MSRTTIETRVVQRKPRLGEVGANADAIEDSLVNAAEDGIDLVVFPELFLTGYHIGRFDTTQLLDDVERAIEDLSSVAPGVTAVIGTPTESAGQCYNSAIVLEDGAVTGTYQKVHLYDRECDVFEPGGAVAAIDTNVGKLGVQICYDVEFPEISRSLAIDGADLLVTVSANMRPFVFDQTTYHAARALENVLPHVLCNRTGTEEGVEFFGNSGIVDERGRSIVTAGEDTAIELTGPVALGREGQETLAYLDDRRPDVY